MVQIEGRKSKHRTAMGARQIYEAIRDQILGGAYEQDGLLPSSRAHAAELAVSRTTVTAAYEQLAAEGFIDIRPGARPRVAYSILKQAPSAGAQIPPGPVRLAAYGQRLAAFPRRTREPSRKLIADFHYGDLASSDFPTLAWKRAVIAAITRRSMPLSYDHPCGLRPLRAALQRYLWRARMLRCELDQIVVVNGSQQGLDLCARLLLDPGDRFVIEDPCYAMARRIFAATGASPISIEVDGAGLNTERLGKTKAQLAYVTPSHQFPMGAVMPMGRRHQLLAWARRASAYVIEDDYDSEYRYDINPVPPLYGLGDAGNVIYLGTVSKTLSPTLRIGYLVVPPQLVDVFAAAKQLMDRHTPVFDQEALASLIESGVYERHIRAVRRRNGQRRATLLKALAREFGDQVAIEGADAGLHIVVWLKTAPQAMESTIIKRARAMGLGIYPVSPLFDPQSEAPRPNMVGLLMGYASLDERQIERGIQLLRRCVRAASTAD